MIDIESQVFTKVATAVRASYPTAYVTGEYNRTPPAFPAVFLIEADNTPLRRSQSSDEMENHSVVMYELDVFSDKATGRKSEARAIVKLVDNVMLTLGFNRSFLNALPNQYDATIYRMTARYTAVVGSDETIYRR